MQKEVVQNDLTARLVKVVDEDKGNEIVAIGRWHRYLKGYEHVGNLEYVGTKPIDDPKTWPVGLNKPFYLGLLQECFDHRLEWMGHGHYWGRSLLCPDISFEDSY